MQFVETYEAPSQLPFDQAYSFRLFCQTILGALPWRGATEDIRAISSQHKDHGIETCARNRQIQPRVSKRYRVEQNGGLDVGVDQIKIQDLLYARGDDARGLADAMFACGLPTRSSNYPCDRSTVNDNYTITY